MEVDIKLTKRQSVAWKYLTDDTTNEVLFGGGAGSAKSFLGCLYVVNQCIQYPKVRYLIGRTRLTQLKLTTVKTLLDLFKTMNLNKEEHYNYNLQSNVITFDNGSEIILKDLEYYPSDPEFDSLGSLELTGAFVDESSQIRETCYNVLKSRIRYKLDTYDLQPKLLLTCNPSQNWLKRVFYLPHKDGKLEHYKKYVAANAYDNPHLPESYIQTLSRLPKQQRVRLLEGSWDYSEDINTIFEFDSITYSLFKEVPNPNGKIYITCDVARFGSDRSVIVVWNELKIIEILIYKKKDTVEVSNYIKELMEVHKVHPKNVIVDSDGVGGGVADQLRATNFVNNSSPLNKENFNNLKSQCYVKLGELFGKGEISININDPILIDELTQELLSVKLKNVDKDGKIMINSKEDQKNILGHSPDLSDTIMMRMYFEIHKTTKSTGRYSISILN